LVLVSFTYFAFVFGAAGTEEGFFFLSGAAPLITLQKREKYNPTGTMSARNQPVSGYSWG